MKRSKPLKRSPAPRRKARPRIVNRSRRKKNHERAYGGADRITWMHGQSCIAKLHLGGDTRYDWGYHHGRIEIAHVATGGMGRKASAFLTVPLCSAHHQFLHARGVRSFEAQYSLNLRDVAASLESRWQKYRAGTTETTA